jgi:MFS family permease
MINRVIRLLVTSDLALNFALGLLSPIFAIFILKNIAGSSLRVVGLAASCYWIARVISTVPLSKFMDRTDGEKDEFYFVIIGTFIMSSIPLIYLLIKSPLQLYLVQFIYGLAGSMAVPAWRILFTDHIDRGKTGYEWSLEDIAIGCSAALSAFVGSALAERFGFQLVLILLSMLGYVSTILLVPIYQNAKTLAQIKREDRLWKLILKRQLPAPTRIKN